MKYLITTFGCQANMADSEKTAEILNKTGYQLAKDEKDLLSDKNPVLIFNTCSVRQKAEDRVFGLNKKTEELKNKNKKILIILTGCMMHYSEKELKKRLPFFDHFIDIKNINEIQQLLANKVDKLDHNLVEMSRQPGRLTVSALVPVSNGCDRFCTYCIVPLARGREISRPAIDILNDIKKAINNGAKEIWLLGQTVNSYKDNEVDFAKLLRLVNEIRGDFWIRFTSPHPKNFSDDLILAMSECNKFAHYINLPVQSGNNVILKKMGRPYTAGYYKKLVQKIRKSIPDISISTDIIVGFPSETKKQFEDTKKLFKDLQFDMAFISEYSPRPKTTAAKMFKDSVPHKEKEMRKNELNEILKKTALENNKKLTGKVVKVLNGRTENNKSIELDKKYPKDKFVLAKITKANIWSLKGKLL